MGDESLQGDVLVKEIQLQVRSHCDVMAAVGGELADDIAGAVRLVAQSLAAGRKVLVCGNGGSAADAQHFVAEIIGRFKLERRALPAIALSTDTSILTAVGNDYGFDRIFERQVEALATDGDVVVGISTSGNSRNVQLALELGRAMGCRTIAFTGGTGGTIRDVADLSIIVPGTDTPRIQEAHITMIHILCDLVEKSLFAREQR